MAFMIMSILMGIPLIFMVFISIYKKSRINVLSKMTLGEICSMCKRDLYKTREDYLIQNMGGENFKSKICDSCKRSKKLYILKGKIHKLHYNIKEFLIFKYFKYIKIVMYWYIGIMLITMLLMIFTEIPNLIYIVGVSNLIVWLMFFYRDKLISIKK